MAYGRVFVSCLAAVLLAAGLARAAEDGCVKCHADETMEERGRKPALAFVEDLHARAGLSCADCHGGDRTTQDYVLAHHRQKSGFRGKAANLDATALCSECHGSADRLKGLGAAALPSDIPGRFTESVHGRTAPVAGRERPSCVSCHGAHGVRGKSDPASPVHPSRTPETCARCHQDLSYMRAFTSARVRVDQLIEYRTSVHGERLAQGDTKVAVCSSCHGSHDILPATDPRSRVHPLKVAETCGQCHADPVRMEGYTVRRPGGDERPLSTDQLARYRESVHHEAMVERGDLSAPTCNDCHGNHGATPPEVRSVSTVCAQCHSRPAELFAASELRVEVDQQGYPECAICHHQHAIRRPDDRLLAMLAAGESPSEWKPGPRWREVAAGFLRTISDLEARIARSGQQVDRAERYGMDLTRARLRLNQARVAIHSFDSAQLGAIVDGNEEEEGGRALAAAASSLADDALAERSFRRYGLVVALLIIAALVGLLVLKIRAMESTT